MKLGLYGGSFDPIHTGHLLVAQAAMEEAGLDQLVFVPAAQSPFKPTRLPTSATQRLRLLRLALAGRPQYRVDDFEVNRGGVSYSIDTVREFQQRFPEAELFWLIGADHLPTLSLWRDASELAARVRFIVIPRPGKPELEPGLGTVEGAPEFRLQYLRGWPLRVSSSEIRSRVEARKPIDFLVPREVAAVIASEQLYR